MRPPLPAPRTERTRRRFGLAIAAALTLISLMTTEATSQSDRPRARDLGLAPGIFPTGTHNAITDVSGVRVGHATVWEGDSIRTGVTVILPHPGDLYHERVPAAIYTINGFGKLVGVTQIRELGELETPIALTCTLCVWRVADAMADYLLRRPGMETVRSLNPVVGETNDGFLNDIRARPVRREHVVAALESALGGAVAEGVVGAGVGTRAFGWKGGIGTASRLLPESLGGWTVGVLVQSNFGGVLTIQGVPVGRELGRFIFQRQLDATDEGAGPDDPGDGSIMIVVATDAPLAPRNLERLASRAVHGLARTGSPSTNGSGDYVIAFATAESIRRRPGERELRDVVDLPNDAMSPLFQAVVEATEEAIYNSLFRAVTVTGHRGTVEALPLQPTLELLERHGAIKR